MLTVWVARILSRTDEFYTPTHLRLWRSWKMKREDTTYFKEVQRIETKTGESIRKGGQRLDPKSN